MNSFPRLLLPSFISPGAYCTYIGKTYNGLVQKVELPPYGCVSAMPQMQKIWSQSALLFSSYDTG